MKIKIDTTGIITTLDTSAIDPQTIGRSTRRRASHVLPTSRLARALFRGLRQIGLTELSRRLPGAWTVHVISGPTMGPYNRRADAISAEILWLETNRF